MEKRLHVFISHGEEGKEHFTPNFNWKWGGGTHRGGKGISISWYFRIVVCVEFVLQQPLCLDERSPGELTVRSLQSPSLQWVCICAWPLRKELKYKGWGGEWACERAFLRKAYCVSLRCFLDKRNMLFLAVSWTLAGKGRWIKYNAILIWSMLLQAGLCLLIFSNMKRFATSSISKAAAASHAVERDFSKQCWWRIRMTCVFTSHEQWVASDEWGPHSTADALLYSSTHDHCGQCRLVLVAHWLLSSFVHNHSAVGRAQIPLITM